MQEGRRQEKIKEEAIMASKGNAKGKLVAGNKPVKPGGMKGGKGTATGMQEAQKFGKKAPFGKGK